MRRYYFLREHPFCSCIIGISTLSGIFVGGCNSLYTDQPSFTGEKIQLYPRFVTKFAKGFIMGALLWPIPIFYEIKCSE